MSIITHVIILSIVCFLLFVLNVAYEAVRESNLDEYHLKNSHDLELKPMFPVNHDGQDSTRNLELKQFYDNYNNLCGITMKNYNSLLKTVNNYVQRYVSLFLIISGIFDQERKDSDEMITIDLEITISPEDLAYLQNFSQRKEEAMVLRDLSRLDAILSKIVKRRERSYLECALRFSVSLLHFLGQSIYRLFVLSNFYNFTPFLTILLVTFVIYCFSPRRSFYVYLGIILNSMIFWESLKLYRKKIKDIEIELETLKLRKMPEECDEANIKWYHYLMSVFTGDRCHEYHKNMSRNPLDEVSLLQCIFDTYSLYTFQAGFKILGASIRDFTGEISALWPKPVRFFLHLPLLPFIIVIVTFLILILCGKRLKLSFFGASVEIGDSTSVKETMKINKKQGPRRIVSYRPLRILARSRFFRRSETELVKEKKSIIKASKSEGAIEPINRDLAEPSTAGESEIAKDIFDDF